METGPNYAQTRLVCCFENIAGVADHRLGFRGQLDGSPDRIELGFDCVGLKIAKLVAFGGNVGDGICHNLLGVFGVIDALGASRVAMTASRDKETSGSLSTWNVVLRM